MGRASALIAVAVCAACDGSAARSDADLGDVGSAGVDADLVNFTFRGRYLDWDSTSAAPCPIVAAKWYATYDDSRVSVTDSEGVFSLRLAAYTPLLDVLPPAAASACAEGTYTLHGIAIAPPAVVAAGGELTARSMTTARIATFYASIGAAFDASRGHLLVHVNGPPRALAITGSHGPVQSFSGSAWSPGDSGTDVFFPNIELSGAMPTTTVTATGGNALGLGSVPLVAGAITYMPVVLR